MAKIPANFNSMAFIKKMKAQKAAAEVKPVGPDLANYKKPVGPAVDAASKPDAEFMRAVKAAAAGKGWDPYAASKKKKSNGDKAKRARLRKAIDKMLDDPQHKYAVLDAVGQWKIVPKTAAYYGIKDNPPWAKNEDFNGYDYVSPNGEWLGNITWGGAGKHDAQVMTVVGVRPDGQPRRSSKSKGGFTTVAAAKTFVEAGAKATGTPHLYPKGTKHEYTKDTKRARLHRALDSVIDGGPGLGPRLSGRASSKMSQKERDYEERELRREEENEFDRDDDSRV